MNAHPRLAKYVSLSLAVFLLLNVFGDWVSWSDISTSLKKTVAQPVQAISQFTPNGGILQIGTNIPVSSAAATANSGGWQATLASDNIDWVVSSTASGLDQELIFDGAQLNNANKFIITLEAGASATTQQRFYQICDWSSTTEVDNAADSNCTGGGWRTLNIRDVALTATAETAYTWHIYDGYWNQAASPNTALSTPLSNFLESSNNRILLRAYSATSCTTCTHSIDRGFVQAAIDPIYLPSGMVTSTASTVTGDYRNTTNAIFTGQSASDNAYLQVAGTAGITSDFYMTFKNIRTTSQMNTIVMRAEYSCSATGLTHRPRIWNFTTPGWEDLTTTAIACATGDVTNAFAKNNVTLSDYISGGEIRIGWHGLANGTQALRIDQMYIIVGSVNADSSKCEISFGTGTATDCANTRSLDTTIASPSTWQQTTEAESTAMGHPYYAFDNDNDATSNERAASANLWIPSTVPSPGRVTGLVFAMQWRSNVTTITTQGQFKDFSGANATISGGWTLFGTTNAATTYTYEDSVTNGYFGSNPDDYVDTVNNQLNVRIRTTASTNTTGITRDIAFVFTSVQWAETTPARYTLNYRNVSQGGTLQIGTNIPVSSAAAAGNGGGWQATLASDNIDWVVSSTASGLDQELYMDDVQQNNANTFAITLEAGASATTQQRFYQICDWSSTTEVDNAADSNCTGGGWRTLNIRDVALTATAETAYTWHIYDGYWNQAASPNTSLSTPISNFIETSNGRVLIRAYSATSCTTCTHSIDYLRVDSIIDSVYEPSGMVTSTASTVTGDYRNTTNAIFTGQSASDNAYLQVAGTAGITSDFYMTFSNVRTYSGMNAIVMRAEYSCSATGLTHRPRIWNFTTPGWEDLTTTAIACATGDVTNAFAVTGINVNDYLSNGTMRIGWHGLANGTQALRIDQMYVLVGSVNDDSSQCEISFGTGTATDCANTRSLDTTLASPTNWAITTEAESTAMGHPYYARDNDDDATSGEHAASGNVWIPVIAPANSQTVGRTYAMQWRSNVTTITTQGQFKDLSGANPTISGGWTSFGTTNKTTAYAYEDAVTNAYFTNNPDDYVDRYNGRANVRVATTVSTRTTSVTTGIAFIFAGIQWVEPPGVTPALTLSLDTGAVNIGSLTPGTPIFATSTATVEATNLTSGYQLLLARDSATSTLAHTDAVTTLPDYTAWTSGSPNSTSTPGNTFAFRVSTSTGNYNSTWWGSGTALFAGMPSTMETIMNCTTCNSGVTTSSISYRVNVPTNQKTGTYNGTSTYTALSNP